MYSKAASRFSCGTCHATSAPCARLVASSVCRTRRIVPARSIAWMRAITSDNSTPDRREISPSGSRWNPSSRSSDTARILALIGSVKVVGIVCSMRGLLPIHISRSVKS